MARTCEEQGRMARVNKTCICTGTRKDTEMTTVKPGGKTPVIDHGLCGAQYGRRNGQDKLGEIITKLFRRSQMVSSSNALVLSTVTSDARFRSRIVRHWLKSLYTF